MALFPKQARGSHLVKKTYGIMLDHPITLVLNVFWHWKATGLKVSKGMGIQNQEEHIGHVKQLKSDRYQDHIFFSQA